MMDDETGTYGLFAIGDACVALPLAVVREVTPCPDRLAALPTTAPGLLGAVNLRGQVIGVLDLLALNGTGAAPGGDRRVIVVLLHREKLLGLVVDGVHGVTSPTDLQQVSSAGPGLPISHTFADPQDGNIVSVLDVDAVFGLPGIPAVHDDRAGSSGSDGVFSDGAHRLDAADLSGSMLLVRCAEHLLAVNIDAVHTIVPRVQVRNSPLRHGSCRGVTDFGGVEIPVFDPLALAGLGELSTGDTEGVAVKFRDGVVVMLLSEILELIPASSAERFELPQVPVPGRKYLDGVLRVPGRGDFLALAIAEILRHDDLNALSRLNTPPAAGTGQVPAQRPGSGGADAEPESEGTALAGRTYLTFCAATQGTQGTQGRDFAVPLDQILEILPFPERYSVLQAGDENTLGLFTHRNTVVPLFRLSGLLGLPDLPGATQASLSTAYVLIVTTGPEASQVVGLVVHALRAIERSVWEDPAGKLDVPPDSLAQAVARRRMIRLAAIGTSDEPRMLPRVDLSAIGAALVPVSSSPVTAR